MSELIFNFIGFTLLGAVAIVLILGIYTPLLYNNLLITIFVKFLVCGHKKLIVKLVTRTSLWVGTAIFAITLALLLSPLYVILDSLILNEVFLYVAPLFAKERSAIDAFCVFWTFVFPKDVLYCFRLPISCVKIVK